MSRLFGTDGIRGKAFEAPLDAATIRSLGRALVRVSEEGTGKTPVFLLGGDTRASTPDIAEWLAEGISFAGGELTWAGVIPTPAVSRLLADGQWSGGIVISASHNPACDNGIKVLDAGGAKISREEEIRLEELIAPSESGRRGSLPPVDDALREQYRNFLLSTLDGRDFRPMHLVLDAAHGAASGIAEDVLEAIGMRVTSIASEPDGNNINDGVGATRPERLAEEVRRYGADGGLALDGDADRLILADEDGRILDGDDILLAWGRALKEEGRLPGHRIVATVMSNFGLESSLSSAGIELLRCPVGDRSVWEKMQQQGSVLGGEQSGHIICSHHGVSGDGLLTALHLLALCEKKPLSELSDLERLPQVLINVPVTARRPFEEIPSLPEALEATEDELEGRGRILLRYSGTELLARVMLEGEDEAMIRRLADRLASIIRA